MCTSTINLLRYTHTLTHSHTHILTHTHTHTHTHTLTHSHTHTLTHSYCSTIKTPYVFSYRSQDLAEGPTTNQAVRRQVVKADAQGAMVYDIKIEDFDINYGNQ